jgi:hypothetical protein
MHAVIQLSVKPGGVDDPTENKAVSGDESVERTDSGWRYFVNQETRRPTSSEIA